VKTKKTLWGTVVGVLLFVLLKLKFLLMVLKVSKFAGTFITMVVMIWSYSIFFGWPFAVGFVILLTIHEFGHVLAAKVEGIPVSMPLFIPFLGAFITMKKMPTDARSEAILSAGGPILGSLSSILCLAVGTLMDNNLLLSLAYVGAFINLFNLVPVHPLDGGRMVTAISPYMWLVGIPVLGILAWKFFNPIILLFLIIGCLQAYKVWRNPDKEYYRVTPKVRVTFATLYFGMMGVLGVVMVYVASLNITGPATHG
jgi:Zn-dependent protease